MEDVKQCEIIPFSEVTRFHGHSCPGSAIGYRVAEIAISELVSTRSEDEELVAIVENDSCSVDAIQVVTGCTLGKGNLIFKDHGKQVYTFLNRKSGKAVRIALKNNIEEIAPEFSEARKKASSPGSTPEEKDNFLKAKELFTEKILKTPASELFKVESVEMELPEEARIFKSVQCAKCGEPVAEHRARVENGEIVCIPCFNDYSRK